MSVGGSRAPGGAFFFYAFGFARAPVELVQGRLEGVCTIDDRPVDGVWVLVTKAEEDLDFTSLRGIDRAGSVVANIRLPPSILDLFREDG